MIRFFIKSGNNSVKFDAPTDELFDHLGSIGINEDIPYISTSTLPTIRMISRKSSVKDFCPRIGFPM